MTGGSSEPKNVRKQRVIRRIQEYKKFRSNCQRLREFIKEKHQLRQNVLASHKVRILSVGGRSKSEQALLRRGGVVKNDRLMGRLCVSSPNLSQDLSLEEAIHLWRLKRDRQQQQPSLRVTNNKFIFTIFPFLLRSINIGKRKSSVPQFSFNLRL